MSIWTAWRPQDLEVVVVFTTAALAYCAYHYGTSTRRLVQRRLVGALLLGVVPALVAFFGFDRPLARLGLGAAPLGTTLVFAGGALVVLLPILFAASRTPAHQAQYPELRAAVWTPRMLVANTASWIAYLAGYELFFRGFLLFSLTELLGVWPGIAATTALYVLVHLPKRPGETFGCFFMGVVFAWMTLETGAVWAAVLTHIGIAVSSELFALRANPAMRVEWGARRS